MIKKILMFLVVAMMLTACGSNNVSVKNNLIGKTYVLDDKVFLEEESYEVAITITFEQGKLSGRALNHYNSSYKIEGNNIEISPMATTLMAGPEKLMKRETEYFKDLTSAVTISLDDDLLIIKTLEGKKLLFKEIK